MANIVIKKGQENYIVVTVSDRSILNNPFNLIIFYNKFNPDVERSCVIENISNNRLRYDEFIIEEISNPDNLEGQIFLLAGEWSYEIYESSIKTLDISDTTGVVLETGLVIVIE